ncbi:MAG: heme-copper oxidase subunit III, partial [Chitinophagales bacterium]
FTISTIVIVFSSASMHAAYLSFKSGRISLYKGFIILTLILGASFLTLQIQGWEQLVHSGIALSGNVAGSFIYVISGAHFLHVAGGVIALLVFSILAFTRSSMSVINNVVEVDREKVIGLEVLMTFWHFVGILWVYLYFFFLINN